MAGAEEFPHETMLRPANSLLYSPPDPIFPICRCLSSKADTSDALNRSRRAMGSARSAAVSCATPISRARGRASASVRSAARRRPGARGMGLSRAAGRHKAAADRRELQTTSYLGSVRAARQETAHPSRVFTGTPGGSSLSLFPPCGGVSSLRAIDARIARR